MWIGGCQPPSNVREAAQGWRLVTADDDQPLRGQLAQTSVAVVQASFGDGYPSADPALTHTYADAAGAAIGVRLDKLLAEVERSDAVGIFLVPPGGKELREWIEHRQGQFICVAEDAPAGEIAGRLEAAWDLLPLAGAEA